MDINLDDLSSGSESDTSDSAMESAAESVEQSMEVAAENNLDESTRQNAHASSTVTSSSSVSEENDCTPTELGDSQVKDDAESKKSEELSSDLSVVKEKSTPTDATI